MVYKPDSVQPKLLQLFIQDKCYHLPQATYPHDIWLQTGQEHKFNHAYLVLLPTGFTFAFPVTKDTGALLPHHFTLTLPRPEIKHTVIICLRLVSLNYINIVFGILPFKYYLHILIFTYQQVSTKVPRFWLISNAKYFRFGLILRRYNFCCTFPRNELAFISAGCYPASCLYGVRTFLMLAIKQAYNCTTTSVGILLTLYSYVNGSY